MLTNNQLLLVKVETTSGDDAAPVKTADAVLTNPVDVKKDIAVLNYPVVRSSISAAKTRMGRKMVNFTITCPLKGSGTAGTPPELGALLQACAHKQTISALTSVTYKPVSAEADHKTVTIYFYFDGVVIKAVGCMGNFVINTPPGDYPTITFNMRGKLLSQADATLPTSPTLQTTEPVVIESAGVSFGTFDDAVIRSFGYESGNDTVDRPDINSSEGVKGVRVTGRNPKWSADVEATVEATNAWWGNQLGRVEEAIDVTIGTAAGNIIGLAIPKACIESGAGDPQSDNGLITYNLSGQALESSGDDNITISFT